MDNQKLTKEFILKELEDQAKSINGTMTYTDEESGSTLVTIKNDNGEYLVRFSVENDYIELRKFTNTGAGDGVSGECNEDILTQVIQDIDEAEEMPDDSDEDDDDSE